jgi:hypothetical protein
MAISPRLATRSFSILFNGIKIIVKSYIGFVKAVTK